MQVLKSFSLMSLLFAMALFTISCGGSDAGTDTSGEAATEQMDAATTEEAAPQGPEYTSAYICPMHCAGSGSDEPGQCPVCGMDYVANADQAADEHDHDHDHDHEGHSHD
jgi:hypothetical protein